MKLNNVLNIQNFSTSKMSPHLNFLHMTRKFSTDNVRGVRDKYQVCDDNDNDVDDDDDEDEDENLDSLFTLLPPFSLIFLRTKLRCLT